MKFVRFAVAVCCVMCIASIVFGSDNVGHKQQSFAFKIAEMFKNNDADALIDLVRKEDRQTATNDLNYCQVWFSQFKGRKIIVNKFTYKLCYPGFLVEKIDSYLTKGESLFLYIVVAVPNSKGSPADMPHCYLHVVETSSGEPRIVGRVVGSQFVTEHDVDVCFDASQRDNDPLLFRGSLILSDNIEAWSFAGRVEALLKEEGIGGVRRCLEESQCCGRRFDIDQFLGLLANGCDSAEVVVLPYRVEELVNAEPGCNYCFRFFKVVNEHELRYPEIMNVYADYIGGKWILAKISRVVVVKD